MMIDDERRVLMAHLEVGDQEFAARSVEGIKRLSDVSVQLFQLGHRSETNIELFGSGSSNVGPEIPQAIVSGDISIATIFDDPNMKEMLERHVIGYEIHENQLHVLNALLLASTL